MLCCVPFRRSSPQARKFEEFTKYYEVEWTDDNIIGRGGFSKVYRGLDKQNGRTIAVKQIPRQGISNRVLKQEIKASIKVKGHPNIVDLYDVFVAKDVVILCLEYMEGDILFKRILNKGPLPEIMARKHFLKVAEALHHLHMNGIVHRDLKPENLMFDSKNVDAEIKLTDFGLCKILPEDGTEQMMKTFCGTLAYLAPEGWAAHSGNSQYGPKVDEWSFGVTLYVCLAGYHPFDPAGSGEVRTLRDNILNIRWGFNDAGWQAISEDAKDLLRKLLCPQDERLSTDQILEHRWFNLHYGNGNSTKKAIYENQRITGKRPQSEMSESLSFSSSNMNSYSIKTRDSTNVHPLKLPKLEEPAVSNEICSRTKVSHVTLPEKTKGMVASTGNTSNMTITESTILNSTNYNSEMTITSASAYSTVDMQSRMSEQSRMSDFQSPRSSSDIASQGRINMN
uniref:Protein kinase domain-containing protein n=1 Tax=Aplanochytrium stocchinoi TaxID=215587 RepID=A0A7S3LKP6_9STRA|mmetsp:Transcript_1063/g.1345  ORF Transcript_1063/g.1345 Transcript_1063/m.1345 type:complete len:452 (-) Transcript_1063:1323-2678(-)|eukprot:CAMPEP_0204843444 /NCGR_PEP_ID=MMETSP1346-20131115/47981_1 /ASSEMBLY_ACC=CAM_ASM_000771 /TAXON_ID=215587 /ORGANISM="Aplanochytrium stocchinoi, Strain GSBS06" /LENGTH=451 /DNA_ID=CAMNT_0051982591 /DNA_START=521 /DNA_END=1876 /DNA_ORIENTATION=+